MPVDYKKIVEDCLKQNGPQLFAKMLKRNEGIFAKASTKVLADEIYKKTYPHGYDAYLSRVAATYKDEQNPAENDEYGHPLGPVEASALADELIRLLDEYYPAKSGQSDNDAPTDLAVTADLDSHRESEDKLIVPEYDREASPETDPDIKVPNYEPPTREDSDQQEDDFQGYGDSLEEYISIAFISTEERNKIPLEDFCDPSNHAFPLRTKEDIPNILRLLHHSNSPSLVKRNMIKIARRKNIAIPSHISHDESCVI